MHAAVTTTRTPTMGRGVTSGSRTPWPRWHRGRKKICTPISLLLRGVLTSPTRSPKPHTTKGSSRGPGQPSTPLRLSVAGSLVTSPSPSLSGNVCRLPRLQCSGVRHPPGLSSWTWATSPPLARPTPTQTPTQGRTLPTPQGLKERQPRWR